MWLARECGYTNSSESLYTVLSTTYLYFIWKQKKLVFFAEQGQCVTKQVWIPYFSRKGLKDALPGSILSTRMLPLVSRRKYSVMMPSIFNVIGWFD